MSTHFIKDNIEQSFYLWQHSPLLKNISFEDFKEWILPYRTVDEVLTYNKQTLYSILYRRISINGMEDIRKPIECYKGYIREQREMNKYIKSMYHIGCFDLFLPAFKMDCSNLAARTCNYFRACGIPVVYEFTPQWPDKDSRHYWCASPDSSNKLLPYTPPYNNLQEDWLLDLKYAGKVFQMTFGTTKDSPYFLKQRNEIVPKYFNIPTIKDVTNRYHLCSSVEIKLNYKTLNNLAYLCFFNTGNNLSAVAWGKINYRKNLVIFENIPLNMLFFPCLMNEEGEMFSIGNPFMLRKDSISGDINKKEITCNQNHLNQMHLLRKYPSKRHLIKNRENLIGARLLGSNSLTKAFDTLYIIKNIPEPYWQEYQISNFRKYRYYKFETDNKSAVNIAEFEFLGRSDRIHKQSKPTSLPIFSLNDQKILENSNFVKIEGIPLKAGPLFFRAYDNNPETFVESPYLGMDFTVPICITGFRMLPRNAMNVIEPKEHYQLLYYKCGEWIKLSDYTSKYNYLDIDSVPEGTIYWLRNLDKGKEELPFFYKKGKQIFINQYM